MASHTPRNTCESRNLVGGEGFLEGFGETIGTMARFDDDWPFVVSRLC